MTLADIAILRLSMQQISGTKFKTPKEIVGWLGAVQAQDYAMSKWAVGVRLPGSTDSVIEKAIDKGDIIRTHVLRPTWHFVSKDDIRWMLRLTAPRVNAAAAFMFRKLELTDKITNRCNKIIEKTLGGGKHLTRLEIMNELGRFGIRTDELRGSHIMFRAELDAVVCNGSRRGKQFTYALLDEKVPDTDRFVKDEALAKLAQRYFTSHGPATIKDFIWWSGLGVTDAKAALEMVKSKFIFEKIADDVYWFPGSASVKKNVNKEIYFLPAFDEFTISYKNRNASLDPKYGKEAVAGQGIFKPIIVVNGKVIGVWKRTVNKNSVVIEPKFFDPAMRLSEKKIAPCIQHFGKFIGMKPLLIGF